MTRPTTSLFLIDYSTEIAILNLELCSYKECKRMTNGELLNLLTEEAKKYHRKALSSVERNWHMNNLSSKDLQRLIKNQQLTQDLIDALLVDFINFIGVGLCVDYGLYTKNIQ